MEQGHSDILDISVVSRQVSGKQTEVTGESGEAGTIHKQPEATTRVHVILMQNDTTLFELSSFEC